MFDALKKKFSEWMGKKEKTVGKPKKLKKEEGIKEKPKKEKIKVKKTKHTAEQIQEERKVTEKVIEDIKQEKLEIKSPEEKTEELLEAISEVEETKEEQKEPEKAGFFSRLKQKLTSSVLSQQDFDDIFYELEITLLENNVALEVVDKIKADLSKDLVGISIKKDKIEKTIVDSLKQTILSILIEPEDIYKAIEKSLNPYVIVFFGINGSGKTTSIAKLANKLKQKKISCVLAAGDTFRAASIEQLETHSNKIKVPIIKSQYGSDPASVAFDAISYAKKNKIKVVLIDTAGRMYTKANLLKEMEKIIRISKPNLKIFVGESITGNDATEQARTFNEVIGIDGVILTKADVDEKAGTILSVSHVTGKPIYFLGVGQEYKDLTDFKKSLVLKNLGLD